MSTTQTLTFFFLLGWCTMVAIHADRSHSLSSQPGVVAVASR